MTNEPERYGVVICDEGVDMDALLRDLICIGDAEPGSVVVCECDPGTWHFITPIEQAWIRENNVA